MKREFWGRQAGETSAPPFPDHLERYDQGLKLAIFCSPATSLKAQMGACSPTKSRGASHLFSLEGSLLPGAAYGSFN